MHWMRPRMPPLPRWRPTRRRGRNSSPKDARPWSVEWPMPRIKNPQELAKLQSRVAELEEAIATLPERQARASVLNAERSTQLGRLGELRRRKSRLVDESARRLNEALGPRVRVRLHALAERSKLHEALEDAVRGQSVRGEQITKLAGLDPVDVAGAARTSVDAVVDLGVTATTANKLVELAPSVLRDIEQVDVPDRVELQINLGTPRMKIGNRSTGSHLVSEPRRYWRWPWRQARSP